MYTLISVTGLGCGLELSRSEAALVLVLHQIQYQILQMQHQIQQIQQTSDGLVAKIVSAVGKEIAKAMEENVSRGVRVYFYECRVSATECKPHAYAYDCI